jgi:hypothetical protein
MNNTLEELINQRREDDEHYFTINNNEQRKIAISSVLKKWLHLNNPLVKMPLTVQICKRNPRINRRRLINKVRSNLRCSKCNTILGYFIHNNFIWVRTTSHCPNRKCWTLHYASKLKSVT